MTRIRILTAGVAGTGLCCYRVRGVDFSSANCRLLYGHYTGNIHTYYYYYYYYHSITPSLFHSRLKNPPILQILPTVAFLFFFRTDYMDSTDCLLILLGTSVFYVFSCFPLFSCWFHAID